MKIGQSLLPVSGPEVANYLCIPWVPESGIERLGEAWAVAGLVVCTRQRQSPRVTGEKMARAMCVGPRMAVVAPSQGGSNSKRWRPCVSSLRKGNEGGEPGAFNIVDDAPMSTYELADLVGTPIATSSDPLANPWFGQLDGATARSLGFRPVVATTRQSQREGTL